MEMLVGAIGGCIAVTTRAFAQRKRWGLEGISVEVEMERFKREDYPAYTGDAPYVYEVRERINFEGMLTQEQKDQLKTIAGKCPVHRVLESPVFFVKTVAVDGIRT
jgi:putative redox protein